MQIRVTKEDIEQGQRRDPEQCAVARALLRAGLEHFGVMGPSVMVSDGWGRLTSFKLPENVSDWIFNFDAGNAVAPFAFEVELPDISPAKQPLPEACDVQLNLDSDVSLELGRAKPVRRGRTSLKVPKLGSSRHRRCNLSVRMK